MKDKPVRGYNSQETLTGEAQKPVMIPTVRQRVRIEGREEVFLVVWVDLKRNVADLVPIGGKTILEEDVPFAKLRAVNDEGATAAE